MADPGRPASPAGSISTVDPAERHTDSAQPQGQSTSVGPSESTQTVATSTTKSDHPRVTIVPPEDYRERDEGSESLRTTTSAKERRDRQQQSAPPATRPTPTRRQSIHRKHTYSVDDNQEEVLEDQRLKQQLHRAEVSRTVSTGRKPSLAGSLRRRDTGNLSTTVLPSSVPEGPEEEIFSPSRQVTEPMEEDEVEVETPEPMDQTPENEEEAIEDGEQTLKERQDAINETHPFGVKLWKSSLYKKDRSVQKLAEEDVHSAPGTRMGTFQEIGNILWSLTVGWWMSAIAFLAAAICFLTFTRSGREYAKVLYGLSRYLIYPFGQYIQLRQDENYLDEDLGEGRSISEYEQWQAGDIEEGRLFFGPLTPRALVGRSRQSLDNISEVDSLDDSNERTGLISGDDVDPDGPAATAKRRRLFGRGKWSVGRVTFYILFYTLLGERE
ncbi:hypothetical protein ABW20_dc0108627 [Dactylellina cionopaga]|nr:hypothetical protein ABW20_dc0108627 [Dactylellina cionopaga]